MPRHVNAINFWIEPLNAPTSAGGTFLIVWPKRNGEASSTHDADPDFTVMLARAAKFLLNRGERSRGRAIKIYRPAPVLDQRGGVIVPVGAGSDLGCDVRSRRH